MGYNVNRMLPNEASAYARLRDAARRIDPALIVDRGSVHRIDGPFPGVSYNLLLGDAHALLFLPSVDIDGAGWEERLPQRLEAARRYLLGFTRPAR
jgi:hypothetical protein